MARQKRAALRQLEMVSLTDVILLMLIFALVQSYYEFVIPGVPAEGEKAALRITHGKMKDIGENVREQPVGVSNGSGSQSSSEVYRIDHDFYAADSTAFSAMKASGLITKSIVEFRQRSGNGDLANGIHVEADPDTPFRIIDFIIRQCGRNGEEALGLITSK